MMKAWSWGVIGSLLVSTLAVAAAELAPYHDFACQSAQGSAALPPKAKDNSTSMASNLSRARPAKEAVMARSPVRSITAQEQHDFDNDAYDDGCE